MDNFTKAMIENSLINDINTYSEALDLSEAQGMAEEVKIKMHELFRFTNQLQAIEDRKTEKIIKHMEEVEDQEFKHGEQREAVC